MRRNLPIDGIVLAAGRSSRMGRPKALLDAGSETFLGRAVRVLAEGGCRTVVVVLPAGDDTCVDAALAAGAIVALNPEPGSEPVDSVRVGLQATAGAGAAVVLPVDYPLVQAKTVAAVVQAWRASDAPLVLPEHDGLTGHPLLIDRALFDDVLTQDLDEGLHTLIRVHADALRPVNVRDAGIHIDIDTADDYARHFPGAAGTWPGA